LAGEQNGRQDKVDVKQGGVGERGRRGNQLGKKMQLGGRGVQHNVSGSQRVWEERVNFVMLGKLGWTRERAATSKTCSPSYHTGREQELQRTRGIGGKCF